MLTGPYLELSLSSSPYTSLNSTSLIPFCPTLLGGGGWTGVALTSRRTGSSTTAYECERCERRREVEVEAVEDSGGEVEAGEGG